QRSARGERGKPRRISAGNIAERGTHEKRDRRCNGDCGVTRAAEKPKHQPREETRIDARLWWQSCKRCVADPRGQEVGCQSEARDDIGPQPGKLIGLEQPYTWREF